MFERISVVLLVGFVCMVYCYGAPDPEPMRPEQQKDSMPMPVGDNNETSEPERNSRTIGFYPYLNNNHYDYNYDYDPYHHNRYNHYNYNQPNCLHVSLVGYGFGFCGGLTRGSFGSCDRYCGAQRAGYSAFCKRDYCLCHRGQELGGSCQHRRI